MENNLVLNIPERIPLLRVNIELEFDYNIYI